MLIRTAPPVARTRRAGLAPTSEWPAWFAAAGVPIDSAVRRALQGPLFSTTQLAVEAAVAGRGVALAPALLVAADIASGRLVRLFGTSLPDPNAYWLLSQIDRANEARIRAFSTWIKHESAATLVGAG